MILTVLLRSISEAILDVYVMFYIICNLCLVCVHVFVGIDNYPNCLKWHGVLLAPSSALDKLLCQLGIYATWLSSIAYLQKQLRIFIFFYATFSFSVITPFLIA